MVFAVWQYNVFKSHGSVSFICFITCASFSIFTSRKRSLRRLGFTRVYHSFCSQGGVPGVSPQDQVHPRGPGTPPCDQVHPRGPGTLPWDQVHPQDQVHPPGPGTPPRPGTPPPGTRYTPLGPGTPPRTRYTPRPGTPPRDHVHPPPLEAAYSGIRSTIGRYASYWNAILLELFSHTIFKLTCWCY